MPKYQKGGTFGPDPPIGYSDCIQGTRIDGPTQDALRLTESAALQNMCSEGMGCCTPHDGMSGGKRKSKKYRKKRTRIRSKISRISKAFGIALYDS